MTTVDLKEIQRDVAGYLHRAAAGESILVTEAEKPIVHIGPAPTNAPLRQGGLAAGMFSIPDDFDDPLPDEVLRAFEGG